jgi:excisionase family DNA binding protein
MTKETAKMYLTPKEAAPLLTVSYWTVLRMIEKRQLKAVRVSERYRIPQAEIDRVMRQPHK